MPDGAEEDHAGHLAEQLEEGYHEANGPDHVQPGHQPHLNSCRAAFLVPELLVTPLGVEATAIPFSLHATGIGHAVLRRPGVDSEPIRVIPHAAAVELKFFTLFLVKKKKKDNTTFSKL